MMIMASALRLLLLLNCLGALLAKTYDFIIVGAGPGGITLATKLSADPKVKVLLLEAGADHDNEMPIYDSAMANAVASDWIFRYLWQIVMVPLNLDESIIGMNGMSSTMKGHMMRELADIPEDKFKEALDTIEDPGTRRAAVWAHRRLHESMTGGKSQQYGGGRVLGGGSSINGEQYVWPTEEMLETIAATVGDPAWGPDNVHRILKELETYRGTSQAPQYRGKTGPINVLQSPQDATISIPGPPSPGLDLFNALKARFGLPSAVVTPEKAPVIDDYNDPNNPISIFRQWQLTQNPDRTRCSASRCMLTDTIKMRKNLVVETLATVTAVKFDGQRKARGVAYQKAGQCTKAVAKKEVILAAGIHSSLILELSGIGDKSIIQPLLKAVGKPFIANVPGVGAQLQNDDIFMFNLFRPPAYDSYEPNPNDLWQTGAFLPKPTADDRRRLQEEEAKGEEGKDRELHLVSPVTENGFSPRFSQWWGQDLPDAKKFVLYVTLLDQFSTGWSHIQSGDPWYWPNVSVNSWSDERDVFNWFALMQQATQTIGSMQSSRWRCFPTLRLGFPNNCSATPGAYGTVITPTMSVQNPTVYPYYDYQMIEPEGPPNRNTLLSNFSSLCDASKTCPEELETQLLDLIKSSYLAAHHFQRTCQMGDIDRNGVVDSSGRVHGVTRLRVADGSIYPVKLDGNTQVPAYIAGAVIAEKIIKEYKLKPQA